MSKRKGSKLDEAQRHLNKQQAARAESTFRQQPKAQKQSRTTKEEREYELSKGRKRIDEMHKVPTSVSKVISDFRSAKHPFKALESGPDKKKDQLKKKRESEKKRRTKASGGTRQSQKRRQGNY
jgi:hypothetical protein